MAELDMKDGRGGILAYPPYDPAGIQTYRVNGASELKPGYVCTTDDHTWPDVGKPDAAKERVVGVVLDLPDQDLDTYYDDDKDVPVAMRGSGALVWVYLKANAGAAEPGAAVIADAATDNGYVILQTASSAPGSDTYNTANMQTALDALYVNTSSFVGYVAEYSANDASNDRPIKVRLA